MGSALASSHRAEGGQRGNGWINRKTGKGGKKGKTKKHNQQRERKISVADQQAPLERVRRRRFASRRLMATRGRRGPSCHLSRQRSHRSHAPPGNPSSHTRFVTSRAQKCKHSDSGARPRGRSSSLAELPYPLALVPNMDLPPPRTYLCPSHHFTTCSSHHFLLHPPFFFSSA